MPVCKKCNTDRAAHRFAVRKDTGKRRGTCLDCHAARTLAEYHATKEQNAERHRANRQRNYARNKVKVKAYCDANKGRRNAHSLAWAARNRTLARQRAAEWGAANPERRRETGRKWRAENPEAARAKVRNRRAQLKVAGTHDADDVLALYDLQGGRCNGCGWKLPASYHVDHMNPVSRGGSNGPENLQLLCPTCNISKGARTMAEWNKARGLFVSPI